MSSGNTAYLKSYDDEPGTNVTTGESSREIQGKYFKGNTSKLKYLYTNLLEKQTGGAESHHATGKPWCSCCHWNLEGLFLQLECGYQPLKLFRRSRWGRRGGSVIHYIKEGIECEELSPKNGREQIKSLWVTVRGQDNKGSLLVGA